jgi:hypothetical protein
LMTRSPPALPEVIEDDDETHEEWEVEEILQKKNINSIMSNGRDLALSTTIGFQRKKIYCIVEAEILSVGTDASPPFREADCEHNGKVHDDMLPMTAQQLPTTRL